MYCGGMFKDAALTPRPVRVRLPSILPVGPALLFVLLMLIPGLAVGVALRFVDLTDAYPVFVIVLVSILIAHFVRPGWLEFDRVRQTVQMVSIVQRQFEIASWLVVLKPLPTISLSQAQEILICRDEDLQFRVRMLETDGKEHIICDLWPVGYRDALKFARCIEACTGIGTRLRAIELNATGKHEVEWTEQSNRQFRVLLLFGMFYAFCGLVVTALVYRHARR